jgi:glycolate oxidase FAD binding subunit
VSLVRERLEAEIGVRAVGSLDVGTVDGGTVGGKGRSMPLAFASSEEQVIALLRLAATQSWRVLPIGSGTKVMHGPMPDKPRFALSVRGLSGVTAYERGDGTISARAGSTMAALAHVARSGGNHLTPDVARPEQATLGGVLAAGSSGIDRLRYGPVRNHVLGMRVALSDGTVAKSGGRLVKNVTGYDLHRLYTGSRGTLCVILEASLRLFPSPERVVVITTSYFTRDTALAAATTVLAMSAKPTCVIIAGPEEGRWKLTIALAGRAEVVDWERAEIERVVGDCEVVEDETARAALDGMRDREGHATLRANVMPGGLQSVSMALDAAVDSARLTAECVIQPGIATVDVLLRGMESTSNHVKSLLAVARALADAGAVVELREVPFEARAGWDPLATVPLPARTLMARVKKSLDPAGRFGDVDRNPVRA